MAEVLAVDITSFVRGLADVKDRVVFLYRESVGVKFPDWTEGRIH